MGETAPSDGLRLRNCPGCGYSLETLPAVGMCPECGRGYDQKFLVYGGVGRGQFDRGAFGTWRGLIYSALYVLGFYYLARFNWSAWGGFLVSWLWVGIFVAVAATHLYAALFAPPRA